MNIIVTGGAGFIGSNFVQHVLANRPQARVWTLDSLTYAGNLENLAPVEGDPRHAFVRGDIRDPKCVADLLAESAATHLINFAAETHVDRSIEDSAVFISTNIAGAHTLLEAARNAKLERVVQVGTDEAYGSLGETGLFTEDSPLRPNSPYAAAKTSADLLCRAFHHTHGVPVVVTRCSNNYGPYQFPEKFLPLMIHNALSEKQLPVYGDGANVRDWIHVSDHCAALLAVLERGRPGEVYNIGADSERRNIDVVRLLLKLLDKPETLIKFVKDRPGHDRRYAIDSSKARRELGWRPAVNFDDGLRDTIAWYRENAAWVQRVTSGEYQDYYRRMYRVDEGGAVQR